MEILRSIGSWIVRMIVINIVLIPFFGSAPLLYLTGWAGSVCENCVHFRLRGCAGRDPGNGFDGLHCRELQRHAGHFRNRVGNFNRDLGSPGRDIGTCDSNDNQRHAHQQRYIHRSALTGSVWKRDVQEHFFQSLRNTVSISLLKKEYLGQDRDLLGPDAGRGSRFTHFQFGDARGGRARKGGDGGRVSDVGVG
jgi:hypothetical protein